MLKQRHSSSGLSAKTLSRSKFVNKTVNQNHNVSTESGKQGKTLRYPVKNKSCLIPRHLAQSTQSHILNSNESNRYKTNNRNQPSQKMQSNVQNRHPNIQKNTAQMEYNMKQRVNLVESKLTQPQVNFRSSQLGNNQQQRLSYKPFLSVPSDECNVKGNILSRLSDLTENISSSQLIQKIPYEVQRTRGIKQQSISGNNINMCNNNTSIMMRQRVLQKSVKQSYLYKSMQLSKGLQEMHRFYICVNELKWVCEQVYLVIRKYNEQIVGFYQQYSIQNRHNNNDLENIQKQSEQLLKRFNQLEVVNGNNNRYGSVGQLVGFNLMSSNYGYNCVNNNMADKDNNNVNNNNNNNNNRDSKGIVNTGSQFYPKLEKSHINNFMKTQNYNNESPQYSNHLHSWSKLIDNIQQHPMQKHNNNHNIQYDKNHNNQHNNIYNHHHHPNNHTAPTNQQNKNTSISINTFQLTQANSPFKNKTLNQLIRLSQLRKTQFMQNYTNTENKQNLYHLNNSQYQNNQQNLMCNINQTNQKYNLKGKDIDSYCLNNINDNNNNRNNNINDINYNNNSRFTKKPTLLEVGLRHISPQKDPFDSIHLPHFSNNNNNNNNNPLSKQSQQQFDHNMISIQQRQQFIQQKQFYQQQLIRLNHIIQAANIQNIQIHKIMDNKFKQLEREKNCLKQQLQRKQQKFGDYQKCIYKLVERALNELVICGRLNNSMGYYDNDRENNIGYNRENSNQQVNAYSVDRKSYSMNNLCDVERRQLINNRDNTNNNNSNKNNNNNNNNSNKNNKNKNHKSVILQPMIMINNKSFFSMVDCLQQVFRLDSNSNANKQFIQCNNVSYKDRVNSQEFQYQKVNDNNNDNNKKSKKQKNKQSMQIFQSNHNTNNNHNNVKNYNRNNKFQQQQQSLLQQIHQLQTLKHQLQQQIIKQQKQFNLNNNNNNMIQQKRQSHIMSPSYYDQLTQVMFAQAVTIEDMLILNNSNDGQQQQQGDNNNYHGQY